jgi:hypothetical protein
LSASSVKVHAPLPEQAPDQPLKIDPLSGLAVRVMVVPRANAAEQALPQPIPGGLLETVPEPDPVFVTVKVCGVAVGASANAAFTALSPSSVIVQLPVPEQAPDQPVNVEPLSAVAVTVTLVPRGNEAEQAPPHVIPAGLLVTVPAPLPPVLTVSV